MARVEGELSGQMVWLWSTLSQVRTYPPWFDRGAPLLILRPQGTGTTMADVRSIQGPTSRDHIQASREDIEERRSIAIEAIQLHKEGSGRDPRLCRVASDNWDSSPLPSPPNVPRN